TNCENSSSNTSTSSAALPCGSQASLPVHEPGTLQIRKHRDLGLRSLTLQELKDALQQDGIVVERGPQLDGVNVVLRREGDGKAYRFTPTDDGLVSGSQIYYARQFFGLEHE
ncbi:MAG TPA: hypothetical protein VMS76_20500, partial [Planctomycetota bacterium]|nr:hypothetical protein [Planctomycetota bacterium]